MDGDEAVYTCHHCETNGKVSVTEEIRSSDTAAPMPPREHSEKDQPSATQSLQENQVDWLGGRGIGEGTIARCGLVSGSVYIQSRKKEVSVVGFPYENSDQTKATKWRDGLKNFSQTGAARSLWRLGEWKGGDLIICEGELDACSFEEVGVFATSVPNGAPLRVSRNPDDVTKKYSYLWDAKDQLKAADRIIIATDSDDPGKNLGEEIARRVGKARCWKVQYPAGCKDANDVLMQHGRDALKKILEEATPWPVSGLRDVSEFRDSTVDLYRSNMEGGYDIGIPSIDAIYRPWPQTFTVITGVPSSGKSSFSTWLMIQLAKDSDVPCAVFSAENPTQIHLLQMAAVLTDKPFYGEGKMDEIELQDSLDWLSSRFVFLDEADSNVDSILERAQAAVLRNGVRILVVDPFNYLSGAREGVEGTNRLMTSMSSFAKEHGVSVWLIAHPTKQYPREDGSFPKVRGYSISGGAPAYNSCDNGLTVEKRSNGQTLITSWKSRYPWMGSEGSALLSFDTRSGRYSEAPEIDFEDIELDDF
tara:strand:+ start:253 stop:1848 length:1596 start_codon:yes stop_codon:yes gene_type:complete